MKLFGKCIFVSLFILNCTNLYAKMEGQARLDSIALELSKAKDDTIKIKLLADMSLVGGTINPDLGIKYGQQSLDLAKKLDWEKGTAWANVRLGSNFDAKADFSKALECYFTALKIFEGAGIDNGIETACTGIGHIRYEQGQFPGALEYYFKTLKLNEQSGDKGKIASSSHLIGNVYYASMNYPKALEYYLKAKDIYESVSNKEKVVGTIGNIGLVYWQLGDFAKAQDNNFRALKLARELKNKRTEANSLGNIGGVYNEQKNYSKAIEYNLEAVKILEEIGDTSGFATALGNVGENYLLMASDSTAKNTKTASLKYATEYLKKALSVLSRIGDVDGLQYFYQDLYKTQKLSREYSDALHSLEQFIIYKDSVFSKDNEIKISKLETKRESDLKEKQIAINNLQSEKKRNQQIFFGICLALLILVISGLFFYLNFVHKSRRAIQKERDTSDTLLLNILPAEVADELKTKGSAEAKLIDEATVLFTDFKGFTLLSEKLTPKALVAEINECFSAFDLIMEKYGVEKIKTIGDSYMAAGGLPTANKTHPDDVVRAALEIQQYMMNHKIQKEAKGDLFFEIRIGVHTGPVVAGIVGIKKFQYDIWGDTVNTASRMESSGAVGRVNISGTTYELVKEKFTVEYRGEIEAKHKGHLKMYFVS